MTAAPRVGRPGRPSTTPVEEAPSSSLRTPGRGSSPAGRAGLRPRPLLVGALLLALLTGACGVAGLGAERRITLTIGLFGNFGYEKLYVRYQTEHPGITIKQQVASYSDHHADLTKNLRLGRGAADIEAIDTGFIARFKAEPDWFVDLRTRGAENLRPRWLNWKWEASLAAAGEQIGYGTDVGGLAICYRRDLFARAGLPADRDEVGALWPTWEEYLAVGRRFAAGAPAGTAFFDGSEQFFNAMVGQAPVGYYDFNDRITLRENREIRTAWSLSARAVKSKLSAGLSGSTPEWNAAFDSSGFATVVCPAWMMTKIQTEAEDFAGKWDVAAVPGGGGNWGGSYLTVPQQGDHPAEAAELAAWLTAPEQQAEVFVTQGNLPSTPALYDRPEIVGFRSPFFNQAPVGLLFTNAAKDLQPQYQGPRSGDVQTIFARALLRVEKGEQSADAAWKQVLAEAEAMGPPSSG